MEVVDHLRKEFELRIFQESYPRIEKCLSTITEEQIWSAPNENMVSIGCLIKHLMGNVQQWVLAGVLALPFERNRDAEFVTEPELTKSDLLDQMNLVQQKLEAGLLQLTEEHLNQELEIQGFQTTGFSAIVHVIEHFSYHTGQIALLTKLCVNEDLGFYDGLDLDKD